ncbi:GNAT family N-acetyltransferase, partial [Mycobacterium tuberculosis]
MIRGVSSEGAHVKPSNIRIRAAKPIDFPKVAAMHYPVWRQSWTGILDPYLLDMIGSPKLWVEESYPQSLKRGGWSMWIAESGGQPIGMTMFGPDIAHPDRIQIDALYVAENSQRHGIGGRLLNRALHSHPSAEPPRHVRRLQFLERMGSCQVVHRGGTRRSCVSG